MVKAKWCARGLVAIEWLLIIINGNPLPSGDRLTNGSLPAHFMLWGGAAVVGLVTTLPFFWQRRSRWIAFIGLGTPICVTLDALSFTLMLNISDYGLSSLPVFWIYWSGITYWTSVALFLAYVVTAMVVSLDGIVHFYQTRSDSEHG